MIWIDEKELEIAVDAMIKLAASQVTAGDRHKVIYPHSKFSRRKWEGMICALLASGWDWPEVVLPEKTHLTKMTDTGIVYFPPQKTP